MGLKRLPIAVCSSLSLPVFPSTPSCNCITSSCSSSSLGLQQQQQQQPSRYPINRNSSRLNLSFNPIDSKCFHSPRGQHNNRSYATYSNHPHKEPGDDLTGGHHRWPTSAHPTPYEIFDQQRGAPYSKARFFQLVKIYHPDRHHHHHARIDALSHAVRLERYRLIVSANDILCDPTKRRAYDLYGSGWGGKLGIENLNREADRAWRQRPGNASMNATWEDWEQWYDERNDDKKPQRPVFMSNELFVGVLCTLVIIGSMGQARRASTSSMNIVELQDRKHEAISQDMRQQQSELASLDRQGRVENFLRQREGWAFASSTNNPAEPSHQGK